MQVIHANQVASITELKKNPSKLISESGGRPIAILNHNTAEAYLIPTSTFERMLDLIDENELEELITERLSDGEKSIQVNLNEL